MKEVFIDYTNWRGERSTRRIVPLAITYGSNDFHPEPQWILTAKDLDKGALRNFAMKDIHSWREGEEVKEKRAPFTSWTICWGCDKREVSHLHNHAEKLLEEGWMRRRFWKSEESSDEGPWFCSQDCAYNSYRAKEAERLWEERKRK